MRYGGGIWWPLWPVIQQDTSFLTLEAFLGDMSCLIRLLLPPFLAGLFNFFHICVYLRSYFVAGFYMTFQMNLVLVISPCPLFLYPFNPLILFSLLSIFDTIFSFFVLKDFFFHAYFFTSYLTSVVIQIETRISEASELISSSKRYLSFGVLIICGNCL